MSDYTNGIPEFLRCNFAEDPLGINTKNVHFSWFVQSSERGKSQTAYHIVVAQSLDDLNAEKNLLWDTGKVTSKQCSSILYQGHSLKSSTTYYWKVKLWDEAGNSSSFSQPASFETALLESDWKAKWIGNPTVDTTYTKIAPIFRKSFTLNKGVARARVYVTGLGYYELHLNGNKVGDHVLDPGWTDFAKRVLFATYDVTNNLQMGENVIGAIVGSGWHGIPKLKLQLNIEFVDGTTDTIITAQNKGWFVSMEGPIRENSIYHGEVYDARREIADWDTPNYRPEKYDNHKWMQSIELEGPGGKLVPQELEPIKVVESLKPVLMTEPKAGIFVYDVGQNISGWANIAIIGEAGAEVTLKFAELLHEDGTVNQANLRTARAMDVFIIGDQKEASYEPRFTYHGFRYVQVEITSGYAEIVNLTACVVRSAVQQTGSFECSHPLINQIQKNVVWTEANNLHSIPTDCPQRDERMGWLNDLTVRSEEAIYNFNLSRFYTKYIQDIEDTQGEETGAISDTAPRARLGCQPADPVSTSFILVPWLMYIYYGDRIILEKHYDSLKKWANYIERHTEDHIVTYSYYGDWASPVSQAVEGSLGAGAVSAVTPGRLISTGYHYFNSILLSKMAKVLGYKEDVDYFEQLAGNIATALHQHFFDPENKYYATGSQGAQVLPLYLGIVPNEDKPDVLKHLVKNIVEENDGHLTTGNLCSRYILDVLVDNGYEEVAYLLASQTTYPSWGYMVSKGATTIWERWEYVTNGPLIDMASHNHPMYGAISSWFYQKLAGIRCDHDGPGFESFIVKPHVPENLDYVDCKIETVRGTIKVHWKKTKHNFTLQVNVPWNSEAMIYIPLLEYKADHIKIIENEKIIWEQGQYIEGTSGFIKGERTKSEHIKFTVMSGNYIFSIKEN